jgi:hypothetical protein
MLLQSVANYPTKLAGVMIELFEMGIMWNARGIAKHKRMLHIKHDLKLT